MSSKNLMQHYLVFFSGKTEGEIMDELRKCSNAVQKTAVEQSTYLHASSAKKDYDLEKYKKEVLRELNSPEPSTSSSSEYFFHWGMCG